MSRCSGFICIAAIALVVAQPVAQAPLDREAQRWVDTTFKKLTLDQMVGQVLMPRFASRLHQLRFRHLRSAESAHSPRARRRRDRFRRRGAGAAGAAQPHVRQHHPRPAVRAGLDDQSAAGDCAGAAADGGGFRVGRRDADCGRDEVSARHGVRRGRRRAAAPRRRAASPRSRAARSASTSTSRRSPTSTTTRAIRSSTSARSARIRHASARSRARLRRGLQQGGMIATLKHFPGHGDTGVDSHLGSSDGPALARASRSGGAGRRSAPASPPARRR